MPEVYGSRNGDLFVPGTLLTMNSAFQVINAPSWEYTITGKFVLVLTLPLILVMPLSFFFLYLYAFLHESFPFPNP
jgi:hypothetical protein